MITLPRRLAPAILAAAFFSLLCMQSAKAQPTFGSITEVVTDSGGAAVPNAQITVLNQDTGFSRRQTSAATGVYTVSDLAPGVYRVRIEAKGFNVQEKSGVTLDASHVVTVDAQLTVGSATTQVEVQGTVPIITTETSTT